MNLTKFKNYAPAARTALITAVTRRAGTLGIQPGRVDVVTESGDVALISGQPFPCSIVPLRKQLLDLIQRDGFDHTMEAMAYTWFNRLVALRFMELHDGYLDHGYRVLSHPQGTPLPEILQHAEHVSLKGLDREEVIRLKLDGNRDEELYRLLLLAQCSELHHILPDVFSRLDDSTVLLLPDNLLHTDSVIRQLVAGSDVEDWQEVEVLGWLYQFYISEKKDAVMARKSAVPTDDIPAVTQLFTPHWIVRYLVENSLGRLWLLNRPGSRLRDHMPYYIEGEQETDYLKITKPEDIKLVDPAVGSGHMLTYAFDLLSLIYEEEGYAANDIPGLILKHNLHGLDLCPRAAQLAELALVFKAREKSRRFFSEGKVVRPNILELCDVRFNDDELSEYLQAVDLDSYFETQTREWIEAGELIARNDHFDASETARDLLAVLVADEMLAPCLDSLDLDPRFRAKLRKLLLSGKELDGFSSGETRELDGLSFAETRALEQAAFRAFAKSGEILKYAAELNLGDLSKQIHLKLLHQFEETKNFGSLIQPCLSEAEIQAVLFHIQNSKSNIQNSATLMVGTTHLKVLRVLDQAEVLTQRYHVVVANPPYMGFRQMNPIVKAFVEAYYEDAKFDLCTSFLTRISTLVQTNGYFAMITPPNWLFISSFEAFRARLVTDHCFVTLTDNGRGVWGADFGSTAFVLRNGPHADHVGVFRRLFQKQGQVQAGEQLQQNFSNTTDYPVFRATSAELLRIPGCPIAFWVSEKIRSAFERGTPIGGLAQPQQGMASSDNDRFLRRWHEVSDNRTKWDANTRAEAASSKARWFPYNKGGQFRKWFGNNEWLVNWEYDGKEVLGYAAELYGSPTRTIKNISQYFRESITWSAVSISGISLRYNNEGFIFDTTGQCIFSPEKRMLIRLMGLLNSCLSSDFLEVLAPTVHFNSGSIAQIPYVEHPDPDAVERVVESCVSLARSDWDNFETSWDFRDQPLLRPGLKGATLETSWRNWEAQSAAAIRRMQELETENNRLFIAAYGLEGELQPDVPEEQITLARAEARRDMAAFLSYAVGCMMGRYSPDHPGLILSNAGDSLREFLGKVEKPLAELTFAPDEDGIIPVLDGEWFEDDLVARTKEFLRATFGEAALGENLRFIEQSLGRELRDYFLTDFYKDHLQTYKNRPIYWLFSSGKQKAFQCLVYLHRYTSATLARIRTEYVIPLQGKLSARITRLEDDVTQTSSSATRKKLQTELDKSKKQMVELLTFDEQLRSYADQSITLDLDDGVKTNYAKFGPLVAESKKVCGTKDD